MALGCSFISTLAKTYQNIMPTFWVRDHFHRHSADTTSLVLEGELHVIDVDPETGAELSSRIRKVGDYAHKGPGDVHMERGGPEGALVLFSLYAPDGLLAETLTKDGSVLSQSTTEPILAKINARAR